MTALYGTVLPLTEISYFNPHQTLMSMLVYTDLTEPTHKRSNKYSLSRRSTTLNKNLHLLNTPSTWSVTSMFLSVVCLTAWLIVAPVLLMYGYICKADVSWLCLFHRCDVWGLKTKNMAVLSFKCIISSIMTSYWVIIFCIALSNKLFLLTVDFRRQLWMKKNSSPAPDYALCCLFHW